MFIPLHLLDTAAPLVNNGSNSTRQDADCSPDPSHPACLGGAARGLEEETEESIVTVPPGAAGQLVTPAGGVSA